ncbi:Rhodanese domain protein [Magnetococcus marinus MC-1]|uniref:TVP38/TMEM64 family membrane protein n=1 Tax=Magnetococcus marinus (strain ATCC BAA-1437 / JCM 17883 / MC-1) TaxID=156889 RepID=A0L6N0_MAGMM|nr:VTT domain-containing protein [Magnetococcus marinus]ABK43623.1 Rhodanese domain protein [Magnetococcus marinus MC-1]
METPHFRLKFIGLMGVLALVGIGVWQGHSLDLPQLMQGIDSLGPLAWLAFIVLYAVATVAFLPGSLLTLVGGALFGPILGTLVNLTGATLGAVLAFLIARHLGAEWVRNRAGSRLAAILDGVAAEGWRFVALVRLVPLFPFNVLNYALGLTRIPLLPYLLTTWIAMLPGAAAYTWLGYLGREAAVGGEDLIKKGLLVLGLLVAVALLPGLLLRWKAAQGPRWSIDELYRQQTTAQAMTLLDVRDAKDFHGEFGHIPGSLNIPLPELTARLPELRASGHTLAVVCHTDKRSTKAVQQMRQAGLDKVILVRGGVQAWKRRNWPLERG